MAVTKSLITFWDASLKGSKSLINTLIIPVETPRIHMAMWAPDGLSVIATDAGGTSGGGVYIFRVAEEPECRTVPQFYPSDFTTSEWVPGVGQIEEKDKRPTHLQPRSSLTNAEQTPFTENYKPLDLSEKSIAVKQCFPAHLKFMWLNEELWLRRLDKSAGNGNQISASESSSQDIGAMASQKKQVGRPRGRPKIHHNDNDVVENNGDLNNVDEDDEDDDDDLDGDRESDQSERESDSDDPNVSDNESDAMNQNNNNSDQDD